MTGDQVDDELRRLLPVGWTLSRVNSDEWTLSPPREERERGAGLRRSFGILLRADVIIVTHGNSDAGAMDLHRLAAQRATLVTTAAFIDDRWVAVRGDARLGDQLWRIIEENQPNVWGLT